MSKESPNTKLCSSGGREGTVRNIPSGRPRELPELLENFNVNDSNISNDGEAVFYLSNNRSFQQSEEMKELIKDFKRKMKGKQFKVKQKPPAFCRSYALTLVHYINGFLKDVTFTKIPCNSWTCPACCLIKARRTRKLIREIILLNDMQYFLTLTIDPKRIPKEYLSSGVNKTHKYITEKFNHFITVLKRKSFQYFDKRKKKFIEFDLKKQEDSLKYLWVVEFQKNGNAHLHVVLNKYLPIKHVWNIWSNVGVGTGGFIEEIKNPLGMAIYLTGYITKGLKNDLTGNSHFKYFERRFSVSRSCIRPPKNIKHFLADLDHKNLSPKLRNEVLKLFGLDWIYEYMYNPDYKEQSLTINTSKNETKK